MTAAALRTVRNVLSGGIQLCLLLAHARLCRESFFTLPVLRNLIPSVFHMAPVFSSLPTDKLLQPSDFVTGLPNTHMLLALMGKGKKYEWHAENIDRG